MTYHKYEESLKDDAQKAKRWFLVLAVLIVAGLAAYKLYTTPVAGAQTIEPMPPVIDPSTPENQAKLEAARLTNCRQMYAECAKEVADLQNEINAIHYVRGEEAEEFIGMRQCLSDYDTACLRTFDRSGTCFVYLGACGYTRMAATHQAIFVKNR